MYYVHFFVEKHTHTKLLNNIHLCLQDSVTHQTDIIIVLSVSVPKETPSLSRTVMPFQLSATKTNCDYHLFEESHTVKIMFIYYRIMKNQVCCTRKWMNGFRLPRYFQCGAYGAFLTLILFWQNQLLQSWELTN